MLPQSVPQPIPDNLWGNQWRFATIIAKELDDWISDRPIPIKSTPPSIIELGIASTTPIPGIIIDGGKVSMRLAQWIQEQDPLQIQCVTTTEGSGLVLETQKRDRWILATFSDREVIIAAQNYNQKKAQTQGIHFLLIQPDDTQTTHTGFWLLS